MMKRWLISGGLCSVLAVGLWAAVAAPANFAGTWVLDKAKSESPMLDRIEGYTLVVTQDDKQLTSESKIMAGGQERVQPKQTYNLDGSETTNEVSGRMSGKATNKAKWMGDGKILELNSVLKGSFEGNEFTRTTTAHWELAEGDKVLKIHQTVEGPQGKQESKLTFNKK